MATVAASTAFLGLGAYSAADPVRDDASPRPRVILASGVAGPSAAASGGAAAAASPASVLRMRGGVPLSDFAGPLALALAGGALMVLRRR